MSWVLKGLSCFGAPRRVNAPPKLESGDWNVVVGEGDTPVRICASSRRGMFVKIFCACAMVDQALLGSLDG